MTTNKINVIEFREKYLICRESKDDSFLKKELSQNE